MLPQINLETLGHCQVKTVLALTYITVLFSIVCGYFEPGLKHETSHQHGGICSSPYNTTNFTLNNCFAERVPTKELSGYSEEFVGISNRSNYSTVWQMDLKFDSKLSLYNAFSLDMHAERNRTGPLPFLKGFVNFTQLQIFGVSGDSLTLVHREEYGVKMEFPKECYSSNQIWLLSRPAQYINLLVTYNQYSITWVQDYTHFKIRVYFEDVDLGDYVDSLHFTVSNTSCSFVQISLFVRSLLQLLSIVIFTYWIWAISRLSWRRVLAEHLWMTCLLLAVFLNQDPFFAPMRWYPHIKPIWYLSTISVLLSQVYMMTFWMLMVDGMSHAKRIKQMHHIKFYAFKIAFFVSLLSLCMYIMVRTDQEQASTHKSKDDLDGSVLSHALHSSDAMAACFLADGALFLTWALYILISLFTTNQKLSKLPYVTTRFRQLSFRFFMFQSFCIICYYIATVIFVLVRARGDILQDTNTYDVNTGETIYRLQGWDGISVTTTILTSMYCWLLCAVYIPSQPLIHYCSLSPRRRRQYRRVENENSDDGLRQVSSQRYRKTSNDSSFHESYGGYIRLSMSPANLMDSHCIRMGAFSTARDTNALRDFSLQTAYWLTYFANQAYFDVPEAPRSTFTYGITSEMVRWFGFRIIKVLRGPCDTHAYVAISKKLNAKLRESFRTRSKNRNVDSKFADSKRGDSKLNLPVDDHSFNVLGSSTFAAEYPMIVIAFRGTVTFQNLRTDLDMCSRIEYEAAHDISAQLRGAPKVHRGFSEVHSAIEEPLSKILRDLIGHCKKLRQPPPKIYCTGHSLGGALATLTAYHIKTKLGHKNVEMYNFGAPRVGNHAFASLYDHEVPRSFRVVMDGDVITDTPKLCCLYKHIGSEIMLDTTGNLIINPAFVEKAFKASRSSLKNHSLGKYLESLRKAIMNLYPSSQSQIPSSLGLLPPLSTKEAKSDFGIVPQIKDQSSTGRRSDRKYPIITPPTTRPHRDKKGNPFSKGLQKNPLENVKQIENKKTLQSEGSRAGQNAKGPLTEDHSTHQEGRNLRRLMSAPGPQIDIKKYRLKRSESVPDQKKLLPFRTWEEKVESPNGIVSIYTLHWTSDETIERKISIRPPLIWNGSAHELNIDNVPGHLEQYFTSMQLVRPQDHLSANQPPSRATSGGTRIPAVFSDSSLQQRPGLPTNDFKASEDDGSTHLLQAYSSSMSVHHSGKREEKDEVFGQF